LRPTPRPPKLWIKEKKEFNYKNANPNTDKLDNKYAKMWRKKKKSNYKNANPNTDKLDNK
jgi:hypothetical protein